mgnify:CR=1 FL=1
MPSPGEPQIGCTATSNTCTNGPGGSLGFNSTITATTQITISRVVSATDTLYVCYDLTGGGTAGNTLTAQQIDNNIVRVTIQALSAVLGGTQSLHTNSKDEAHSLPTEASVRTALRTQQILATESGIADTIDLFKNVFGECDDIEIVRTIDQLIREGLLISMGEATVMNPNPPISVDSEGIEIRIEAVGAL